MNLENPDDLPSTAKLFLLHHPKFLNRIRTITAEEVVHSNLDRLLNQFSGYCFRAIPVSESAVEHFRSCFSPRYGLGMDFELQILVYRGRNTESDPDVWSSVGRWRAWDWRFFIPPDTPEGKEMIQAEEDEVHTAELSDMALMV